MSNYRKILNLKIKNWDYRVEVEQEEGGWPGRFKIKMIEIETGSETTIWKSISNELNFLEVIKAEIWYRFLDKHYGFSELKADSYEKIEE